MVLLKLAKIWGASLCFICHANEKHPKSSLAVLVVFYGD
jgi:hypothetical protein